MKVKVEDLNEFQSNIKSAIGNSCLSSVQDINQFLV